jgi:hypothetical protein
VCVVCMNLFGWLSCWLVDLLERAGSSLLGIPTDTKVAGTRNLTCVPTASARKGGETKTFLRFAAPFGNWLATWLAESFSPPTDVVWLLLLLSLHERKREPDVIAGLICNRLSGFLGLSILQPLVSCKLL